MFTARTSSSSSLAKWHLPWSHCSLRRPEVQWVALRNINLLLQKRNDVLSNEMRVFFCKYNDPLYVKVEKLDIMVRLAGDSNVDALLSELKECVHGILEVHVWLTKGS